MNRKEKFFGNIRNKCWLLLLLFTCLLPFLSFSANVEAANSETHYLAFASDRHSNTKAISNAMQSFQVQTEYVGLIGDMVNNTDTYSTSTVKNEATALFSNATVQIMWGTHDKNANDNSNIMFGVTAGSSGLVYTGKNTDSSVAYYVYNIAFYDMNNYSNASTASTAFKKWIASISDKTIPIFVTCHMPLHSQRKDNKGAYLWSKALNYAATGSESGTTVSRDVIYLHGHNHTTESNKEYYYAVGSTMNVQDQSQSVSTKIAYTYLTAGYLNANSHATQVTITDEAISFLRTGTSLGSVTRVGAKTSLSVSAVPKTYTLSATSYVYNGKVRTPSLTIKDSAGNTIASSNYTISRSSGRKNVGIYYYKVTFNGKNYSGSHTVSFTIRPKSTTIQSLKASKKAFTLKWKKQSTQTTGYQICYSTSSKFTNAKYITISKNSKLSYKKTKLSSKKKYYVKIRTYKKVGSKKIYSAYSASKKVTVK